MKKVTIEITESGYTTTLELNGKTYSEEWKMVPTGSECISKEFESYDDLSDELKEELGDIQMDLYDVAKALIYE